MTRQIRLLAIDPQNDFCDLPASFWPTAPVAARPALPVAGAHDDMVRLAGLMHALGDRLTDVVVTLDSHPEVAIERTTFWQQANGDSVAPFTLITAADVREGRFRPRDASLLTSAQVYLERLESAGKYTLCVWPVHCVLGSWGHNLHPLFQDALSAWERTTLRPAYKVLKGLNPLTEQYSAIRAEVPSPSDPSTGTNLALVERIVEDCDVLLVAGEASSHCVRATLADICERVPVPEFFGRIVLLTDAMSPVTGFEAQQQAFFDEMAARGARLATCAQISEELTRA